MLDQVKAIKHHFETNQRIPPEAPLFSFESDDMAEGWAPMTQDWFLRRCNQVWSQLGQGTLTGHCFRIGGATELLLRGTHPDVVAALGSWKSKAFLEYWRRIEYIIPLFVSQASDTARVQLMNESMERFRRAHRL